MLGSRVLSAVLGCIAWGWVATPAWGAPSGICIGVSTIVRPFNPSGADVIALGFVWPQSGSSGSLYSSRVTVQDRVIRLDIVVGATVPEASGFHLVGRTLPPLDANYDGLFGAVGPLAVGAYTLTTTVGRISSESGQFEPACTPQDVSLVVAAEGAPVMVAPVVEYFNASLNHYFMTQNPAEMQDLDTGKHIGWSRTGKQFGAFLAKQSDGRGRETCRWYASPAGLNTHFFSASRDECLLANRFGGIWTEETRNAFEIALPDLVTGTCLAQTVPVYRLWNGRVDSNHRYTTDPLVRAQMLAEGYIPEGYGPDGVAMCAPL